MRVHLRPQHQKRERKPVEGHVGKCVLEGLWTHLGVHARDPWDAHALPVHTCFVTQNRLERAVVSHLLKSLGCVIRHLWRQVRTLPWESAALDVTGADGNLASNPIKLSTG